MEKKIIEGEPFKLELAKVDIAPKPVKRSKLEMLKDLGGLVDELKEFEDLNSIQEEGVAGLAKMGMDEKPMMKEHAATMGKRKEVSSKIKELERQIREIDPNYSIYKD
jgi:hypothetical protein